MKLFTSAVLSLACAGWASALMCVPSDLLGLQGSQASIKKTFVLFARNAAGDMLPLVTDELPLNGTFFFPLKLGQNDTKLNSFEVPHFTLSSGTAFAAGGEVLSTMSTPLLKAVPLFVSADSGQKLEHFKAVPVSCDGTAEMALRFTNVTPLPLASAAINGTFAPGSSLSSPILDNILTAGTPVDLIIQSPKGKS